MGVDKTPSDMKWGQAILVLVGILIVAGAFGWAAAHVFINVKP